MEVLGEQIPHLAAVHAGLSAELPTVLAIVFGVTRSGQAVFMHEGVASRLHLPIVTVGAHKPRAEDPEEVSLRIGGDAWNRYHQRYAPFMGGMIAVVGKVEVKAEPAWVVLVHDIPDPTAEEVPENVHLISLDSVSAACDKMSRDDPAFGAACSVLFDELIRLGILTKHRTLSPNPFGI